VKEKSILIIEDEAGIRLTLEDRLEAEGFEVHSCADGLQGEELALNKNWDLILLDLMLPRKDGLSICSNLRSKKKNTPIIMLTARSSNMDQIVGFRQGADDYIPKPFDFGVLLERINALLRRIPGKTTSEDSQAATEALEFANFTLDFEKNELRKNNQLVPMNAQEFRLLAFLAQEPGKVFDRSELLTKVWSYESNTSTRTIDVHISKLRHHLEEDKKKKYIFTIRGRGYKFVP